MVREGVDGDYLLRTHWLHVHWIVISYPYFTLHIYQEVNLSTMCIYCQYPSQKCSLHIFRPCEVTDNLKCWKSDKWPFHNPESMNITEWCDVNTVSTMCVSVPMTPHAVWKLRNMWCTYIHIGFIKNAPLKNFDFFNHQTHARIIYIYHIWCHPTVCVRCLCQFIKKRFYRPLSTDCFGTRAF